MHTKQCTCYLLARGIYAKCGMTMCRCPALNHVAVRMSGEGQCNFAHMSSILLMSLAIHQYKCLLLVRLAM